jgi:hypothetical protein
MGAITFQVIGDASVGTRTKTFAVSDADVNRLVAWAKAQLAQPGETLTTPQALLRWAEVSMAITKDRVVGYEKAVAAHPPFEAT